MEMKDLFDIVDRAGLRMTEAGELFRLAHSTLYDYRNGGNPKNPILFDHACNVAKQIKRATDQGLLPLRDDVKGKERAGAIRAALAAVL